MKLTKKSSKKRIREAWVAALRSGEYKRVEGALHKVTATAKGKLNHSFCCLGVLCDLAVKAGVIPEPVGGIPEPNEYEDYSYAGKEGLLPTSIREWAGLNRDDGGYTNGKGIYSLADKNDAGKSFKQIAKIIESNPEGLFVS